LFVFRQGERLAFASEIKSFTQLPGWQARVNLEALQQIFTYWAPLSPATAFEGVEEIPPGHYLVCQGGEAHVESYWNLDFSEDQPPRSDADYLEEFSALLIDATQIRLRADVPVGAYLSGGLDSSTTAAVIRQYTDTPLDTFSIAFTTPSV
jgi:asparagine synthase (glutamine-hydrolysing)